MAPETLRFVRYLSGNGQSTTAYALSGLPADGVYANNAALVAVNANLAVHSMGWGGEDAGGRRMRGVFLQPFGQGTNNTAADGAKIYAVHYTGENGQGERGPLQLRLLLTCALTLANAVGSAPGGSVFPTASERLIDTITITKSPYLKELERALGLDSTSDASGNNGARAFSPADDTQGGIWIPDLGNADGLLFDTDLPASNFTYLNWLIRRDI